LFFSWHKYYRISWKSPVLITDQGLTPIPDQGLTPIPHCRNLHAVYPGESSRPLGLVALWGYLGLCGYRGSASVVVKKTMASSISGFVYRNGLGNRGGDQAADRIRCSRRDCFSHFGRTGLHDRHSILWLEKIEVSPCSMAPFCADRNCPSFFCCFILCSTDPGVKKISRELHNRGRSCRMCIANAISARTSPIS